IAWPLHKDDTLFRSGRPTGLNIYAIFSERSDQSRKTSQSTIFLVSSVISQPLAPF
ncbi:hypothetical protein B0H12DRAFT_1012327, partial [Mycena haematopus]